MHPETCILVLEGRYNYFIIFKELLAYLKKKNGADFVCETPTFYCVSLRYAFFHLSTGLTRLSQKMNNVRAGGRGHLFLRQRRPSLC